MSHCLILRILIFCCSYCLSGPVPTPSAWPVVTILIVDRRPYLSSCNTLPVVLTDKRSIPVTCCTSRCTCLILFAFRTRRVCMPDCTLTPTSSYPSTPASSPSAGRRRSPLAVHWLCD
ncbi:hypothetical protein BKA62DRAFT_245283 [Auriculariales sp. MPI-PUGE-AT-0066]|nr:hypothetical protein BKA62DRAFT_245283 [Auriculariales sp. MPI-PUGE-AT-0066]